MFWFGFVLNTTKQLLPKRSLKGLDYIHICIHICACVCIKRRALRTSAGWEVEEIGWHPIKEKSRHEKKEILYRGI